MTIHKNSHQAVYDVVRRIPPGFVATYGQIARLAGIPGNARQVGYALSGLAGWSSIPWHRVINAQGRISARSDGQPGSEIQRLRLEDEGVSFDEQGRVPLEQFLWRPHSGFLCDKVTG
jgi:methylated-DNA-protein-cysteine methyltransferase-like protein